MSKRAYSGLVLAIAVLFLHSPILKYPFFSWAEPREVLLHTFFTVLFYLGLATRLTPLSAFLGALGFGIFPGHALALAEEMQNLLALALYILVLAISLVGAAAFEKFYGFLQGQEKIVRQLFLVGIAVLMLWMAVVSAQTNGAWASELSLARWRAEHVRRPANLNHLAQLLSRQEGYPKSGPLVKEITALYKHSLQLDPQQAEAYYGLAQMSLDLGETKRAMELYKKVLVIAPARRETYFYLARLYEDSGQPNQAIEVYNQLLKLYPDDEGVNVAVIDAYGKALARRPQETIYQEKREEVLAAYEQLSKRKKYTANDYFNLGFLYEQVGGFEEAMRFYQKALELAPTHEKALSNLANRYQAAGDLKSALGLYGRLLHYHPRSSGAYLNMGIIYNALGDTDRARYLYQKAVNIDPDNADAYFNLGYLNETAGELREALNNYEKAIENNPKHAEAHYNLGNVYAALEQYPEAIASYLKTVAIDPNHQNAFVNLSILSFKAQDFQGAIHYLEEARLLGYNPPGEYLKALEPYKKK